MALERGDALAKVTTGSGDTGYTGLLGPDRVAKYDSRIEALGHLDEATSQLGVARASLNDERARALILQLQRALYGLMAEVAATPQTVEKLAITPLSSADVAGLEQVSDDLKREVDIANRFIIPGQSLAGAQLDVARAVIRRAERHLTRMTHQGELNNPEILRYLNRLSDVLFILARYVERDQAPEVA
jgi:cob(I)alamin adenosyltransferase